MLPTGFQFVLDDPNHRIAILVFGVAFFLAGLVCLRRQFGRPSNSKSPRR